MQFRDLQRQYEALKSDIDEALLSVAASGGYIMGQPVSDLENQLAAFVGVKHCICCANGTDALTLALKAWGIGKGDAVFVPDFTFFASAEVVALAGATPVFVDVDPLTFNISALDLEEKIQQTLSAGKLTPRVIVAVDLFGMPADYLALQKTSEKYGLYILEDGAQGFGGAIGKSRSCSFGHIATTSFFPAKPLGCYGDGGAVFTNSDEWAEIIRSCCEHGKGSTKYDNVRIGINSRLDTIQAAVLQVKLQAFAQSELAAVNNIATRYTAQLTDVVAVPRVPSGFSSSWAQYTIQLPSIQARSQLRASLSATDIPSMVYYPRPLHLLPAFDYLGCPANDCPTTQRLCNTVLSLPMHPYLTNDEVDNICQSVRRAIENL